MQIYILLPHHVIIITLNLNKVNKQNIHIFNQNDYFYKKHLDRGVGKVYYNRKKEVRKMKIIELSELYNHPFYIKGIEINKIIPNLEVTDYLYRNNRVSHFVYGYKGYACYFNDTEKFEITPGTLCYIPKGTTIHFKEDDKYEYYKIYFDIYDADTKEYIIFSDKPVIYFKDTPKEISMQISEFSMIYSANDISASLKFQSLLYSFLYTLNNSLKEKKNTSISTMLSPAIQYMQNNYTQSFSTRDLADMCLLSEPYFRSLFKKQMNLTPTEYKNYLRIRRACELMINSGLSVNRTSEILGYENVQYFCTMFKRIVGCSPSQYRRGNKHLKTSDENVPITLKDLGIETPISKTNFVL